MQPEGATPSIVRAAVLQKVLTEGENVPEIVVLGNRTMRGDDNNFTRRELGNLREAYDERLKRALGDTATVEAIGLSQGAAIVSGYAEGPGRLDQMVIVEAPNVVERSLPRLVVDFARAGTNFPEIARGQTKYKSDIIEENLAGLSNPRRAVRYGLGLATLTNATIFQRLLCHNTLQAGMEAALEKGVPVVHSWGEHSTVSYPKANKSIAQQMGGSSQYRSVEFAGDYAHHALTNDILAITGLTRLARSLRNSQDT